ncbi:uncharacterized protein LOC119654170 [Hermetia illucens]|uniref:uncharacterized protein LOC119654170 n=1 Tax=Hermetia illucens TaxID=343691 RepID=UPI0018CC21F6|nr:uncharacterized protein LOC119654170 [Hermetia illucens]
MNDEAMMRKTTIRQRNSLLLFSILAFGFVNIASGQSNYASHANNVEYQGEGLPEEATLDGKVTKLDDLSPIIFLNRTKAVLNCGAGSMQVDLKFNERFYGIAYADFDRNSACQVLGKGDHSYRLELPLKGCGTKQDPQRVFTNNIVVRFHPGLEMDGDEIITIVCRYPPPVAPIPAGLPAPILNAVVPASVVEPPLKGIQILMIICAIMFLTLLLLGLGVSYYCLRRRPIPVVRRLPMSMGSGSEITKLSGSSLGNISAFEGLKIPRAHAPLAVVHSSSGSDGPLISDTIPSDYPSESHSEIEEIDTRSLPASSAGSYENRAFVQETSSLYSENYGHTQEFQAANAIAQASMVPRHPIAVKESSPQFDVQVRVKRAPPLPPSPMTSDTESVATSRHDRNNLSTIMESHEDRESVITMDSLPQDVAHSQFTYIPELHAAPKLDTPPEPGFARVERKEQTEVRHRWPVDFAEPPPVSETRSLVSLGTEMTDTHSVSEMLDTSHLYPMPYHTSVDIEQVIEPPIVVKKPQISSHTVDDVFLRTITEKKTIEDIESHKRRVTEYKAKPIPDPTWDVTIRNYPTEDQIQNRWENFSDISSASGMTLTPKMERASLSLPPAQYISESGEKLTSPELVGNMKPIEIPPQDRAVPNWDILIRVLENADMPEVDDTSSVHSSVYPLTRQLSYEDKTKWKEIITTQSTLRTMLSEAVVREDFERIRNDIRYERIFEPQTWDVLIRILAPPEDDVDGRVIRRNKNKKEAWDTRSRRSSLPTLYEYDSDGGSSVRTIRNDPMPSTSGGYQQHPRSRRTSRSSYRSDNVDMRSMSEMTVDFGRPDHFDNISEGSSIFPQRYYDEEGYEGRSVQRSLSHPSLARSASEFTEHWIAPEGSDMSSPDTTPRARRSQRVLTTFQSRPVQAPAPPTRNRRGSGSTQVVTQTQYVESRVSTFQTDDGDKRPREW